MPCADYRDTMLDGGAELPCAKTRGRRYRPVPPSSASRRCVSMRSPSAPMKPPSCRARIIPEASTNTVVGSPITPYARGSRSHRHDRIVDMVLFQEPARFGGCIVDVEAHDDHAARRVRMSGLHEERHLRPARSAPRSPKINDDGMPPQRRKRKPAARGGDDEQRGASRLRRGGGRRCARREDGQRERGGRRRLHLSRRAGPAGTETRRNGAARFADDDRRTGVPRDRVRRPHPQHGRADGRGGARRRDRNQEEPAGGRVGHFNTRGRSTRLPSPARRRRGTVRPRVPR